MIDDTKQPSLAVELTALVSTIPGVVRMYPPMRPVAVVSTMPGVEPVRRLLTELGVPSLEAGVVVNESEHTVIVSLGINTSESARDIIDAVCAGIEGHLATVAEYPTDITITIAHIAD